MNGSIFGHSLNLIVMNAMNIDRVQLAVKKCYPLIEVLTAVGRKVTIYTRNKKILRTS